MNNLPQLCIFASNLIHKRDSQFPEYCDALLATRNSFCHKNYIKFSVLNWRANIQSVLTHKKLKITPVIGKVG